MNLTSSALFTPDGLGPEVTMGASSRFRVRLRVPATADPGVYRIGFRCGGGNIGVGADLRVMQRAGRTSAGTTASAGASGPVGTSTSGPAGLAVTGDRTALVGAVGAVLVVLGGVAVVLGRRRRTRFVADE